MTDTNTKPKDARTTKEKLIEFEGKRKMRGWVNSPHAYPGRAALENPLDVFKAYADATGCSLFEAMDAAALQLIDLYDLETKDFSK